MLVQLFAWNRYKYFDEWVDDVHLIKTLDGFALACEFPIEAKCDIEEIADNTSILAGVKFNNTFIENAGFPSDTFMTYEQNFSEIHPNMHGLIRVSFLVDADRKLTVGNDVAEWDYIEYASAHKSWKLIGKVAKIAKDINIECLTASCCDGVLVCGKQGHSRQTVHPYSWWSNVVDANNASFIVDFRDDIRPRLSPSRIASEDHFNKHPSWKLAQRLIDKAYGNLWCKILDGISDDEEVIIYIKLATIYGFELSLLSPELIKNKLLLPICDNGEYKWKKVSDVSSILISKNDDKFIWSIGEGQTIELNAEENKFSELVGNIFDNVVHALTTISTLEFNDDSSSLLNILNPNDTKHPVGRHRYEAMPSIKFFALPYTGKYNQYLSVPSAFRSVNANHPIVKYTKDRQFCRENDALCDFLIALIFFCEYTENFCFKDNGTITHVMKRLGCKYELVDWNNYQQDCKPDYKIINKKYGEVAITEALLAEWASYKVSVS